MIRYLTILLIALATVSCNDWLGDNENPNMLSNAPVDALLTSTIEQTANCQYQVSLTTSLYAQYLASPNASEIDRYGRVTLDNCWAMLYLSMANANDLYLAAIKENDYHHAGAALVLLSYNALTTTDLWGDIPFTEAFKGSALLHPKYDTQESVYDSLVGNLNRAITLLKQPKPFRVLSGDILYNSQSNSWVKFAYALKARALIHLSKKSTFSTEQILTAIDSSFQSNADDANLNYAGNKQNPWYGMVNAMKNGGVLNGYLSAQFIESLKGTTIIGMPNDARITAITDSLKGAKYYGTINGTPPPATGFCTVTFNSWQAQKTAPIILFSYTELKFIEAEAALLNGDATRAYNSYIAGIAANFRKLNISQSQIDFYLSNTIVNPTATDLSLAQIRYQKWIALYLQPEGWTDVRRNNYNYPSMVLPANNLSDNKFIQRILYPTTEQSYNSEKLPIVTDVTVPLWWNLN